MNENGTHVLNIRVYHEDTDFTGLVFHGAYVRFCERGRSDFVRLSGISQKDWSENGEPSFFAVRRMIFDFIKPARYDDILEIRTRTKEKNRLHQRQYTRT
ncbi:MAG: YbgC/FadM family acyl-CoA thioesterase, partial [Pseudomonadota bacterium]